MVISIHFYETTTKLFCVSSIPTKHPQINRIVFCTAVYTLELSRKQEWIPPYTHRGIIDTVLYVDATCVGFSSGVTHGCDFFWTYYTAPLLVARPLVC